MRISCRLGYAQHLIEIGRCEVKAGIDAEHNQLADHLSPL